MAFRFPPGYSLCVAPSFDGQGQTDAMFVSAPDSGRIARPQDPAQAVATKFQEQGIWMGVNGHVEDIGLVSPPFAAASVPLGFGNELAVQFDDPISEIAILTNTGIHTIRRRRLVDIFAAAIRSGAGPEGVEGEVRRFIRLYGRGETTATALAVACGQGTDMNPDARVAKISDPDVLDQARKVFIEHGGKPVFNENSVVDQSVPPLDNVRPSPRHEGISLYVSRIVRSIWMAPIIRESVSPQGGLAVVPSVSMSKLRSIQGDITKLQEFLKTNRVYIEGLAGPESLARVTTKQEEIALQAEHRALHSLTLLISDVIEGLSFVLVLFDERVEEIVLSLPDHSRQQLRKLTYEGLFASTGGKELAKELVKAIVNRNIANGSNVDTVAEALRRRCGSFCSAEDVVIFKAQEQLKKASETGGTSSAGRSLLFESLRLLKKVAASLAHENLQSTVEQYVNMQYYAGE
jgi:nuclear pore complex protein Nup155